MPRGNSKTTGLVRGSQGTGPQGGLSMVQIAIRGKNIEVTEALKEYVERKLGRLDRYFYRPMAAQVALSVQRGRHIVEVTVPIDGFLLRGEEASADMYASIDQVLDKLERQIHKYKTRINRKLRRDGQNRELMVEATSAVAVEDEPLDVLRVKQIPVKPMDVEEAILQMNLLGHDFFVFTNASSEAINVVYRRHDGGYGLLEPGGK